jgi:hypothetical protein
MKRTLGILLLISGAKKTGDHWTQALPVPLTYRSKGPRSEREKTRKKKTMMIFLFEISKLERFPDFVSPQSEFIGN